MVAEVKDPKRCKISQALWDNPNYRKKMLAIRKEQGKKRKIRDGLTNWQRYRLRDLEGYRERKRLYAKTPNEKEKRRLYGRLWRSNNREHYNAYSRINHHKHKHKHKLRNYNYHLRCKFGIGLEDYNTMLESQGGGCFLCGAKPTSRRLHVDHDHSTGKVRKLLCTRCNRDLGFVETIGLEKIRDYILMGA